VAAKTIVSFHNRFNGFSGARGREHARWDASSTSNGPRVRNFTPILADEAYATFNSQLATVNLQTRETEDGHNRKWFTAFLQRAGGTFYG
jgi:hypothetical protein